MPAVPRSSLQRFFFGPDAFAEHEELLAFQHRFLITIALCSCVFQLALIATFWTLYDAPQRPMGAISLWMGIALGQLGLWACLRSHPRQLLFGSLCTALLFWLGVCVGGLLLPPDPMLPMWTPLMVVAAFIMMGRTWGWLSCALALATSYLLLARIDLSAYPNAPLTVLCTSIGSALLGHIYVERFHYFFQRMAHHNAELLRLSTYDHLTGTLNAGAYYAQCNAQLALCERMRLPYAVLFVDLDHFKRINDTYGHAMGDQVLQRSAQTLRSSLRDSDLLGRVGGEEFSIFMPNTGQDGSLVVAERVRAAIEALNICSEGQRLPITTSVGLTWRHARSGSGPAATIDTLQQCADKALYDAKRGGRNRVACFQPEEAEPACA